MGIGDYGPPVDQLLALGDLRGQAKDDETSDVEAFLAGVSTPAFDAGH